jgi:hypothetical protein
MVLQREGSMAIVIIALVFNVKVTIFGFDYQ